MKLLNKTIKINLSKLLINSLVRGGAFGIILYLLIGPFNESVIKVLGFVNENDTSFITAIYFMVLALIIETVLSLFKVLFSSNNVIKSQKKR